MFKELPPAAVGLPLAGAVDSLRLAGAAIGVMMLALADIEREAHPIDFDRLDGFQSSCELFALLFADGDGSEPPRNARED